MRLMTRLVLSHILPVVVMIGALAVLLASLARITAALKEVRDVELGSLHREEAVHRAGWAVEVAMRHGAEACAQGRPTADVAAGIQRKLETLEAELAREPQLGPGNGMVQIIGRYRDLAVRVSGAEACKTLLLPQTRTEREMLDEQLTDSWVARMFELHGAVGRKEEEARTVAVSALSSGIALALFALAVAIFLAQRVARTFSEPLAALAQAARRFGRGDFAVTAEARGPAEMQELARELEVMRRRLAELDSLKQGFLASVSHELRTPLTKIREALALLADGAGGTLSERQDRIVHIAHVACEREIRTVTTLLDLSRLRAGSPLQREAGASIDAVLRSAVRDEQQETSSSGVTITLEAEGEAPTCCLDGALIERAVANLVRNAVSVSSAGETVLVRRELLPAGPGDRPGRWIRISVHDHGPGVPSDIRDTLFDTFVTHAVANSPKRVGVGLGLALAREIALAHGGDLALCDGAEGGTVFHLWLPVEPVEPTPRRMHPLSYGPARTSAVPS
jgi:two-component system sensor histidine kinase GlrK